MKCERTDCPNDAVAKKLCRSHYERNRGRHRHRDDRILANRARSRALTILMDRHKGEYEVIYVAVYQQVLDEDAKVNADVAPTPKPATRARPTPPVPKPPVKLRPGPRPVDEAPLDRVDLAKIQCKTCRSYHERGHKCPACEEMAKGAPGKEADDIPSRIRRLLTAGKGAGWIIDQGFSRGDVIEGMRQMTAEISKANIAARGKA